MSTRAQATSVVAAARFPPQGIRGFGNPFTQLAWGPGVSAADYLARANDAVLVLVQIETREGMQNLEEILSVDGVGQSASLPVSVACQLTLTLWMADGVFIGPYDLSLSLGFPAPSPDPHPEVEKVIQQILASSHAKNKKWYVPHPAVPLMGPIRHEHPTILNGHAARSSAPPGPSLRSAPRRASTWYVRPAHLSFSW